MVLSHIRRNPELDFHLEEPTFVGLEHALYWTLTQLKSNPTPLEKDGPRLLLPVWKILSRLRKSNYDSAKQILPLPYWYQLLIFLKRDFWEARQFLLHDQHNHNYQNRLKFFGYLFILIDEEVDIIKEYFWVYNNNYSLINHLKEYKAEIDAIKKVLASVDSSDLEKFSRGPYVMKLRTLASLGKKVLD